MRYLGISNTGATLSVGVYDDEDRSFSGTAFFPVDRILGFLIFKWYKRSSSSPSKLAGALIFLYTSHLMKKLLSKTQYKGMDRAIIPDYFIKGREFIETIPWIKNEFKGRMLTTNPRWSYLNAVKLHPKFSYPALVLSSSAVHNILAYFPSKDSIVILHEGSRLESGSDGGFGTLTVHLWARELHERIHWPGQESKGTKNVYALYRERTLAGRPRIDLRNEIAKSDEPFAEDILSDVFPARMKALRDEYVSLEEYKNDWVASQQQVLRDIFSHIKQREQKKRVIKAFIITGGISNSPAFENYDEWIRVSAELAGANYSGNAMAYLGYCVHKEGLNIEHDRWKHEEWR